MKSRIFSMAVGALIVIVLLLYLFTFQVRETQVAVVTTFGKPSKPITAAGLRLQWPWPIQSVKRFDRRMHVFETRLEETLTKDRQNIILSLAVGWRVDDPRLFLEKTGTDEQAEKWVRQLVDHQSSIIGQYLLENLVSTDQSKIKFEEIEEKLIRPVAEQAKGSYGIDVPLVCLRRIELPAGPAASVYERMKEERRREATKYRSEGEGIAKEIEGRANSERAMIIARAQSDADRIRAEGDAEAAQYYVTFDKNPELAIFLREVKALRRILAERATVVVDGRTHPFNLLLEGGARVNASQGSQGAAADAAKGGELTGVKPAEPGKN